MRLPGFNALNLKRFSEYQIQSKNSRLQGFNALNPEGFSEYQIQSKNLRVRPTVLKILRKFGKDWVWTWQGLNRLIIFWNGKQNRGLNLNRFELTKKIRVWTWLGLNQPINLWNGRQNRGLNLNRFEPTEKIGVWTWLGFNQPINYEMGGKTGVWTWIGLNEPKKIGVWTWLSLNQPITRPSEHLHVENYSIVEESRKSTRSNSGNKSFI